MYTLRPRSLLPMVSLLGVALFFHTSEAWSQQEETPFGVRQFAESATPIPSESGFGVNQVDPATLTCTALIDFEDVAGDDPPGTNYDGVLVSGLGSFAESFAGMTVSQVGDFDVLSGAPTSPLTLQVGSPYENVVVLLYLGDNVFAGLGPVGFPAGDSIGEGSFAALFNSAQFELGFTIVGANDGSATVNFFAADGSLIDTIVLGLSPGFQSFAFRRAGNVRDIAGISIHNDDFSGIGYDNFIVCDDGDGRVTICHIPPGNPDNAHTITVSAKAVPAHLAHGDYSGPCEGGLSADLEAGMVLGAQGEKDRPKSVAPVLRERGP